MGEHKVYGAVLNDDVMYSEDPLVIAAEILASAGCDYSLREAIEEYKRIWCNGREALGDAMNNLSIGIFYKRYPKFKATIFSVINCNSGKRKRRKVEGIEVFLRYMGDEEFYKLPEYS